MTLKELAYLTFIVGAFIGYIIGIVILYIQFKPRSEMERKQLGYIAKKIYKVR